MAAETPPHIPVAVVDWLSEIFPDKCPSESDSDRAIWIAVGAQQVIRKLRKTIDIQSGNDEDEES